MFQEKTIVDMLRDEEVPSVLEIMYLSMLLYPEVHSDFVAGVIEEIGEKELEQRLEQRLLTWTPHALKMLGTDWKFSIDTWTMVLLDAKDRFPESVGLLFTLEELAGLWRNANIRAGNEAVRYLRGGKTQMKQPNQLILRTTLFSGVAPKQIGNPTLKTRRTILRHELPKYLESGHDELRYTEILQTKLDHIRKINRQLVPYLRNTTLAA